MSLRRLGKQLGRELKANRQKAAALGVLALVAGWFWYPLLFKKSSAGEAQAAAANPAAATAPTPAAGSTIAPTSGSDPAVPWHDVARWIDQDPHMQPANIGDELAHNPFESHVASNAQRAAADAELAKVAAQANLSPADLGLTLTSTIVGRHRRAALISGEVYELGEDVPAAGGLRFHVKRIERSKVTLSRDGRDYALNLRKGSTPIAATGSSGRHHRAPTATGQR
ncbi:MAG TPA: hypothetical protein VHZ24_14920 [Pirellulales bacterium]|nr:hypothetical protein [Pirellulales bacterium]